MFIVNTSNTTGQNMKVAKQICKPDVRKYFFTNLIADSWINFLSMFYLPTEQVLELPSLWTI